MQQHGSKYFAARPPALTPDPVGGVKRSKLNLSEHSHVAYQIKWKHECNNMVAKILPADPPPPHLGDGVKRSKFNFSEYGHVAYQINWSDACIIANILPRRHPNVFPVSLCKLKEQTELRYVRYNFRAKVYKRSQAGFQPTFCDFFRTMSVGIVVRYISPKET